jgi:glycerate 2-kinase
VVFLDMTEAATGPKARDCLKDIFRAALAAVDPYEVVARHSETILETYRRGRYERLCVAGFGKAASGMMEAAADRLGDVVSSGVAITKYGHARKMGKIGPIRIYEAGHPLPDEKGVKATREVVELTRSFDKRTLALFLISGGGSALLVLPYPGVSLEEKQKTTDLLLKAGADINELNTVRKHISSVKGGRLAELAYPATIRSLILSDVIDDRLDVIASGPTAPDNTTYADALGVIGKYELKAQLSPKVVDLLRDGAHGLVPETPKGGSPTFKRVKNCVIGSNEQAIDAAKSRCAELGIDCVVAGTGIRGEARDAGRRLAEQAILQRETRMRQAGAARPLCLIAGGETTVTVKGDGIGGRNTELALAFGLSVEAIPGITLLSAGTDGTDGPTDAAGAFVDGRTTATARAAGLNPETYLDNNDSYRFFAKTNGLFVTGPTGTNVMDLQLVLIDGHQPGVVGKPGGRRKILLLCA